jgi:hypothetical protein
MHQARWLSSRRRGQLHTEAHKVAALESIAKSLKMLTEEVSPGPPRWAARLYAILVSLKDGSTDSVSQRN